MINRLEGFQPDQPEEKSGSRKKTLEVSWEETTPENNSPTSETTMSNLSPEWLLKSSLYMKMMDERDQIDKEIEHRTEQQIAITQRLYDATILDLKLQEKFSKLSKTYGELSSVPNPTPETKSAIDENGKEIRELLAEMTTAQSQVESIILVRNEAEKKVRELTERQRNLTEKFFPSEETVIKN